MLNPTKPLSQVLGEFIWQKYINTIMPAMLIIGNKCNSLKFFKPITLIFNKFKKWEINNFVKNYCTYLGIKFIMKLKKK